MIDPDDYWVNNPLITPINKALMYDNVIWNTKEDEKDRIIKLAKALEQHTTHSKLCYKEHRFVERFLDAIKMEDQ